jgi:hypothetical protein
MVVRELAMFDSSCNSSVACLLGEVFFLSLTVSTCMRNLESIQFLVNVNLRQPLQFTSNHRSTRINSVRFTSLTHYASGFTF